MRLLNWTFALLATIGLCSNRADAVDTEHWGRLADTVFHQLTKSEGLLSPFVTSIAEDSEGFLWLGTQDGLGRWDGYRFRNYQPNPKVPGSLPSSNISVLHLDARGHLWIGSDGDGLARYDPDQDRFISYPTGPGGLSSVEIQGITDDGTGGVWVATYGGLDRVDADRGVIDHLYHDDRDPDSLPDNFVNSVLRDRQGRLWIGTQTGFFRRDGDTARLVPVPLPQFEKGTTRVWSLFEDSRGRIWIGTNRGGYLVDPDTDIPQVLSDSDPTAPPLQTETIRTITEASGEIWLGTYGYGIVAIDSTTLATRHIRHDPTRPTSLAYDTIWALYRDRAGSVWTGTSRGLGRHDPRQDAILTLFGVENRKNGVSDGDVLSVLPMPDGRIWLGLGANGIDIIDPRTGKVDWLRSKADRERGVLPMTLVWSLAASSDHVYAATNNGLFRNTPPDENILRIPSPLHGDGASLAALFVDAETLWIGSTGDGLWTLPLEAVVGTPATRFAGSDRLTDPRITVIERGAGGSIWVGTQNGLNFLDPASGEVTRVALAPSDSSAPFAGFVSTIMTDRQGRLWVGMQGNGIAILDQGGGHPLLRQLGAEDGLPNLNIDKLLQDRSGAVWASTDDGLAVIDPATFSVRTLRQAEGVEITSYWINSGAETPEGELLFGGTGGLTVVRPDLLTDWRYRPSVVVTDAHVGGKSVPSSHFNRTGSIEPLIVTPEANSFSVEFAALDYSAPERNRYAYRLDGYDPDWIETDAAHRLAAYTNLPPGDYHLRLRGSNRDGVWTETAPALAIRVLPSWYQMLWFRLVIGCVALVLVAAVVQARTSYLRKRHRELERQVADRTAELRASQHQLEQIAYSDTLTALPNRRMFTEDFRKLAAQARRQGGGFALLLIDLDGFKGVNDTLGHDAGDALLIEVASRLLAAVRETDRVARLGGDEFAVLLPASQARSDVDMVCQRIVEDTAMPVVINGATIRISASIGVALFPEHGETQGAINKSADLALYDAKRSGRNTWRWYDATMIKDAATIK